MLKEILNEMIINSELSQTEIEEKCQVSKGYLSKVLKGTIIPDENKIRKIAKVCNGNIELAVTSLWFKKAPKEIVVKIEKLKRSLLPLFDNTIEFGIKDITREQIEEKKEKFLLSILNYDFELGYNQLNSIMSIKDETQEANFIINGCIPIQDDSMEPDIGKDSFIGIKVQDVYSDGDIVYIKNKNEFCCRKVIAINKNSCFLIANKNKYKKILYNYSDENIKILGKVVNVSYKL